jgi:hypothetical protein
MNGMSRAVATLLGAGVAGFLLWLAAQMSRQTNGSYWAAYGIVAGAGVVLALSQLRGRGGNPPGMFLVAFLPVLVAAGWVLLAKQPHPNWFRGHVLSWSGDIGIRGIVLDVGTWIGVLALGIGYVFGSTLEPGMIGRRRAVTTPPATARPEPSATPAYDPAASDAPTTAERTEVGQPQDGASTTQTRETTTTR